jgi:hypothetical protein
MLGVMLEQMSPFNTLQIVVSEMLYIYMYIV